MTSLSFRIRRVTSYAAIATAGGVLSACATAPAPATPGTPAPAAVASAPAPALTSQQIQLYVGNYTLITPDGQRQPLRVFEENGTLFGQLGETPRNRLVYLGDHTFFREEDSMARITFVVEGNRTAKITIRSGD